MSQSPFWANPAMEPKRQFRFVLELSPLESYIVTKVNRPSFDIGESEHKFINHTFYYPGRLTWNEITLTMVDPSVPDTTGILMKMLMASGYRFPENGNIRRSITKADAVSAIGSCAIKVLGPGAQGDAASINKPEAKEIEIWTLKNPWIKSVSMGDLDYNSDDILTMDLTLRYDWATLEIPAVDGVYNPVTQVPDPIAPEAGAGMNPAQRLSTPNNLNVQGVQPDLINKGTAG
tara:strand:- start:93 stop:791 length:699 start_codon:yes stop_codon:yes gene_type:complete